MRNAQSWVVAIVAGAVLGAVILGFVGRVLLASLAGAMGNATNLSMTSLFRTVLVAGATGILGGFVRQVVVLFVKLTPVSRGVVVGVILYAVGFLFWWSRGVASPASGATLAVAGALYIVFGVVLEKYLTRGTPSQTSSR